MQTVGKKPQIVLATDDSDSDISVATQGLLNTPQVAQFVEFWAEYKSFGYFAAFSKMAWMATELLIISTFPGGYLLGIVR